MGNRQQHRLAHAHTRQRLVVARRVGRPYFPQNRDERGRFCHVFSLDATTGKILWNKHVFDQETLQKREQNSYGGSHWASPVLADGRIYFSSEEGETIVIEPGQEYRELARNHLHQHTQASMAVSGSRLFIRTAEELWAIAH